MAKGNILIVDDNTSILSALDILLSPHYNKVTTLSNPNQLISQLQMGDYHLVLLDMNFRSGDNSGNEGLFWLGEIKEKFPEISVVHITAYGEVEVAVEALKRGATDYILKPWDNAKLLATVQSAIQLSLSRTEVNSLKQKEKELKKVIAGNKPDKFIIGSSPQLMQVLKLVHKVAVTDTNTLITGENGTGKELIAQEIHRLSARNNEMLVSVDMGAIAETLFESELFGHTKGAFTDAKEARAGKFEVAHKGTLFLDEIGNLPLHLQAKLLAALQKREIYRVGSSTSIPIDIRLVCATNQNLLQMVDEGSFREDLLYRINTIHIEIPPLRERGNDILLLADFFMKKYAHKYNKSDFELSDEAKEKLLNYQWPGNIRELEHCIEKAIILAESQKLHPNDFFLQPISPSQQISSSTMKLDEMEQSLIHQALKRHTGNISAAAEQLGITRQTLYNKMKKLGIK